METKATGPVAHIPAKQAFQEISKRKRTLLRAVATSKTGLSRILSPSHKLFSFAIQSALANKPSYRNTRSSLKILKPFYFAKLRCRQHSRSATSRPPRTASPRPWAGWSSSFPHPTRTASPHPRTPTEASSATSRTSLWSSSPGSTKTAVSRFFKYVSNPHRPLSHQFPPSGRS